MHTTECEKFRFFHNADFSGNIVAVEKVTDNKMDIPFLELKQLVTKYVRNEKYKNWRVARITLHWVYNTIISYREQVVVNFR